MKRKEPFFSSPLFPSIILNQWYLQPFHCYQFSLTTSLSISNHLFFYFTFSLHLWIYFLISYPWFFPFYQSFSSYFTFFKSPFFLFLFPSIPNSPRIFFHLESSPFAHLSGVLGSGCRGEAGWPPAPHRGFPVRFGRRSRVPEFLGFGWGGRVEFLGEYCSHFVSSLSLATQNVMLGSSFYGKIQELVLLMYFCK